MYKLLRYAAIGIASLGLSVGVVSASSGTIGTTGPDSSNWVQFNNNQNYNRNNLNSASVLNDNLQQSSTGNASVRHNTTGGGAMTGSASNANTANTALSVNNVSASAGSPWVGGSDTASINLTGPNSSNWAQFNNNVNSTITNSNCITVSNVNTQSSHSGNASVHGNTTGGSASSGNANNTNSTSTTVSITN